MQIYKVSVKRDAGVDGWADPNFDDYPPYRSAGVIVIMKGPNKFATEPFARFPGS